MGDMDINTKEKEWRAGEGRTSRRIINARHGPISAMDGGSRLGKPSFRNKPEMTEIAQKLLTMIKNGQEIIG